MIALDGRKAFGTNGVTKKGTLSYGDREKRSLHK
jgi:hypothetical protein